MNIVVALERKQWQQVEHWDRVLLSRFCENYEIQHMNHESFETAVCPLSADKRSTLAVAFSYDGKYFASGQITHEVVVGYMTPCVRYWKSFFGHDRSPWVLTFDPLVPHILYSGCLNGKVCKWNIQDEENYECSFDLHLSSPVNSIVPLPAHPHLLLVAIRGYLFLLSSTDLTEVWRTQTDLVVRLVCHHPTESKVLIATKTPVSHDIGPTSYTLRLHLFHKDQPPILPSHEHSSNSPGYNGLPAQRIGQLVCKGVRVLSTNSCVMTEDFVICLITKNSRVTLCVYSIRDESCGDCLQSFFLGKNNLVSVDLSPHSGFLLLGFATERSTFHYVYRAVTNAGVYRFNPTHRTVEGADDANLERVCTIPCQGTNVAVWVPLAAGHGYGVCTATTKEEKLLFWTANFSKTVSRLCYS